MSDVQIRRLQESDLPAFKAIRLESLRLVPSAFQTTLADWESLPNDEWLNRVRKPVFVAFRSGEPVGIMGLLRQQGVKRAHRATIIMVYVRESERGRGLAADLLQTTIAFARDEGVWQLELNVNGNNAEAIRFYERFGFRQIGRIPAATLEDGKEVDELMMVSRLT
ncbi:GNAT family N-acetyltransferase [Bordetella tumulicola]|uniref:GNAT family N-acetyltransferase n=1 Tax=Bordetella tumulicola TaxID=1649133 RepID=UPI0039F09E48